MSIKPSLCSLTRLLSPLLLISLALVSCSGRVQPTPLPDFLDLGTQSTAKSVATPSQTPTPSLSPSLTPTQTPIGAEFNLLAGNFRIEDERVKVDVCINLPDDQDWMVGDVYLRIDDQRFNLESGELLLYQAAGAQNQVAQRCDTLVFLLPIDMALEDVVLEVASITAYPREGEYCDFLMKKVQPTLDARQAGFQISCQEEAGFANAQVLAWPTQLSQPEAQATVFSPDFYSISGGWQFTIPTIATVTPFPTVALDDPAAEPYALLRTLNQILNESLQVPGWYAANEAWEHDVDNPSSFLLLNGDPRPNRYQIESWYHVDENGRVDQMVSLLRDAEENILEVYAFANGQYVTSAAPQDGYPQQPYRLRLNEQYLGNLIANLRAGRGSAERSEMDGRTTMLFTLEENWPTPITGQHYNQPILSDLVQAYFDIETGQLLSLSTLARLADGSERVMEQMRLQVSAVDEPPASILDILAELK